MRGPEIARRHVMRMSHQRRSELWQALQAAGAGRLAGPQRAPHPPVASADRQGGSVRIADQAPLARWAALFDSRTWRDAWQPGEDLHLYVIGCTGLQGLATRMETAMAKVGTCGIGGLDGRLHRLRQQRYGDTIRCAARYRAEPGWDDWRPFRALQLGPTPPACPVRGSTQSLIVTAPRGWTAGAIEAVVNTALLPFRLQRAADDDTGRQACRERGVDPGTLIRYSRASRGVEAATELTVIRAQVDAPRLAALIATAIARRVRATAPDPTAPAWRGLDPPGEQAMSGSTTTAPAKRRARVNIPAGAIRFG